jgi:putative ABC transport system permease protein
MTSDPVASLLLAVLVGVAVLVVSLVPRALDALGEAELHQELSSVTPVRIDLGGLATIERLAVGSLDTALDRVADSLPDIPLRVGAPLGDALGTVQWIVRSDPLETSAATEAAVDITLGFGPGWEDRVSWVDGGSPPAPARATTDLGDAAPTAIALSEDAATQLGLDVGDELPLLAGSLEVSGIYRILDPDDPYWAHLPAFSHATVTLGPQGLPAAITASAYVDPAAAVVGPEGSRPARLELWYPIIVDALHFTDIEEVSGQARQISAATANLETGEELRFQTGLVGANGRVAERVGATSALLSLAGSAPLGVVIAVLSLGVRTVIGRRSDGLTLASARGASQAQLRVAMLLEGLLVSVPVSTVAMVAAALILPGAVGAATFALPVILALTVPVLFAASTSPGSLRAVRADLGRGSRRARLIIEVLAVGLAALALFLLGRRGLTETSGTVGTDPLLAATPLLLSLAVCVLVLRLYPIPLLALQRAVRARRGAVGMIGAARATRDATAGPASVLAIVAGVAAALFSLIMATTVSSGLAATARETVGADVRVEASYLSPGFIDAVAAVGGVRDVAALEIDPDVVLTVGRSEVHTNLAFVDSATFHSVRPDLAAPATELSDGSIPYLASAAVVTRIPTGTTTIDGHPAVQVGTLPSGGIAGLADYAIIIDSSFAADLPEAEAIPTVLLVDVDAGTATGPVGSAIAALAGGSAAANENDLRIETADDAMAAALARPTTSALATTLIAAGVVSLALTLLAIVVGTVAATATRNRILGVLRMLGMSPRQARGLVVWELAPVTVSALVAGTALGIALPFVISSVLDLRAFVGGEALVALAISPALVAAVVAGFALVVVAAGAIGVAVARRTSPAKTVKMGAE